MCFKCLDVLAYFCVPFDFWISLSSSKVLVWQCYQLWSAWCCEASKIIINFVPLPSCRSLQQNWHLPVLNPGVHSERTEASLMDEWCGSHISSISRSRSTYILLCSVHISLFQHCCFQFHHCFSFRPWVSLVPWKSLKKWLESPASP